MALVLCDISAARFWASYGAPSVPACTLAPLSVLDDPPTSADRRELEFLRLFPPKETAYALVSGAAQRRAVAGVSCRVCGRRLPARSIYRISDHVYVVSLGLCLAQLGIKLPTSTLAHLASMLCGTYLVDRASNSTMPPYESSLLEPLSIERNASAASLPRRSPVTSIANLHAYLSSALASGIPGSERALLWKSTVSCISACPSVMGAII